VQLGFRMRNTQYPLILSLLTTLFISAATRAADILPIEGALSTEERMQITNSYFLKIKYSSRSTHTGLFGYGWCSELDDQVLYNNVTQSFEWQECGRIIKLTPRKNSAFYFTPRWPGNLWLKTNSGWMLYSYGKKRKAYDIQGRVTALFINAQNTIFLKYETGAISILSLDNRGILTLSKEPRTISEIEIANNKKIELFYENKLWKGYKYKIGSNADKNKEKITLTDEKEESIEFTYNSFFNLIAKKQYIKNSDDITTTPIWSAVYDNDKDLVLSIKNGEQCNENYKYNKTWLTNKLMWDVVVTLNCPQNGFAKGEKEVSKGVVKVENKETKYSFIFFAQKNNQSYLSESIIRTDGKSINSHTYWHQEWGLPTKRIVNNVATIFKYNSEGLMTEWSENKNSRLFSYDEFNRVNTMKYEKVPLILTYNADGDLRRIVKSTSQVIIYDSNEGIERLPSSQSDRLIIQNVIRFVQNLNN
jgi:hypothetical protein